MTVLLNDAELAAVAEDRTRISRESQTLSPYRSCPASQSTYIRGGKRAFDLIVGSLLLLFALPVIIVAWLCVRLTSRGDGFFSQTRVGLHGSAIVVHKLRSMYLDHESKVNTNEIDEIQTNGGLYKHKDDPRVTPVGRVIRKTSIDELPQLWNVVCGSMSLVGPRPLMTHMMDPYPEIAKERNLVRPGITGEWQINARHDYNSLSSMVEYDLRYVEQCSLANDLRIIARTPMVVISAKGAH